MDINSIITSSRPDPIIALLSHIEVQDAHPDSIFRAFHALFEFLENQGINRTNAELALKMTLGHHRLVHLLLKGPPNFLDKLAFKIVKAIQKLNGSGKFGSGLVLICHYILDSAPGIFVLIDYVKDFVSYFILREVINNLEKGCLDIDECLAASPAELSFLTSLLSMLIISLAVNGLFCFSQRRRFFPVHNKGNVAKACFDFVFVVCLPLLPIFFHLKLIILKRKLKAQKKFIPIVKYSEQYEKYSSLSETVLQSKAIEICLEAISQTVLLLGFVSFYSYSMKTQSGQRYSYFYGLAKVVLPGNKLLFISSLLFSLFSPCFFYAAWVNHHKHMSMNVSRMLVVVTRNLLLLVARVGAITSALVIPVIRDSDYAAQHVTEDMTTLLNVPWINKDFKDNFRPALDALSCEVWTNAQFLILFLFLHLIVVAIHTVVRSPKFLRSQTKERPLHLLLSVWLPVPYLTVRGVDRGEEEAEEIFLTTLHAIENLFLIAVSRGFYLTTYPTAILTADLLLLLCQVLGIFLSIIYHTKLELFSSIRDSSTSQMRGGEVTSQKPCTSLAVQEVEMDKMRQAVDISAMERGEGDQGEISGGETSGGREQTEEKEGRDYVINGATVVEEEMKEEEKVISKAEIRKGEREEGGVMEEEILIHDVAVKENEEVVTQVVGKIEENNQSEEGNTVDDSDMRGRNEVREEDSVNEDTGLVAEQAVNKGVTVREDQEVSQEYKFQGGAEVSVRQNVEGVVREEERLIHQDEVEENEEVREEEKEIQQDAEMSLEENRRKEEKGTHGDEVREDEERSEEEEMMKEAETMEEEDRRDEVRCEEKRSH